MAGTLVAILLFLAGCAVPTQSSGPSPEDIARQQRAERAIGSFNDGNRQYDAGNYDDALKSFLLSLDSGLLTTPQQLTARKTMAFIHCVSSREAQCKEEFEKAFALDPQFDLSPAESGHPAWGPIFRLVKSEIELRRSGRPVPPPPKPLSAVEKLLADGMTAYDATDYNKAIKTFQDALKETGITIEDQIKARKFTAFSYCLTNRMTLCRNEFDAIFKINPSFDLEPAEAGHPSWGPSFRSVKAKRKPAAPAKK
jgi:tetratricopeptide (TPR) repeat protein